MSPLSVTLQSSAAKPFLDPSYLGVLQSSWCSFLEGQIDPVVLLVWVGLPI